MTQLGAERLLGTEGTQSPWLGWGLCREWRVGPGQSGNGGGRCVRGCPPRPMRLSHLGPLRSTLSSLALRRKDF